jgi:hypothetical protein
LRKKSSENGLLICISDADVLVKLSKTGNLYLLNQAFLQVLIGPIVEREALRKIGTHANNKAEAVDLSLQLLFHPDIPLLLCFIRNLFHGLVNFLVNRFLIDVSVSF